MEIKIYCILHLKAIEFFLVTSLAFWVHILLLFLHVIEISGILAFPFAVFVDITVGDCGFSMVSNQSFCYLQWVLMCWTAAINSLFIFELALF
jgi:hypothetical protein